MSLVENIRKAKQPDWVQVNAESDAGWALHAVLKPLLDDTVRGVFHGKIHMDGLPQWWPGQPCYVTEIEGVRFIVRLVGSLLRPAGVYLYLGPGASCRVDDWRAVAENWPEDR